MLWGTDIISIKQKRQLLILSVICSLFLISGLQQSSSELVLPIQDSTGSDSLALRIELAEYTTIYEGDVIPCTVTGEVTNRYWQINDYPPHTTFYNDNPVIFDPDPTPLDAEYVNLTVFVENEYTGVSATVPVRIYRMYFGDIQFHSELSDGYHAVDALYANAQSDNYLDFACLTDHAEIVNEIDWTPPQPVWMRLRTFYQFLKYVFTDYDEWVLIKQKTHEYYEPGVFTTLLGFEYSPGPWSPGGYMFSTNDHQDVGHLCFYYRDVYADAPEFSAYNQHTFDDIFEAMKTEYDKGHLNVCFPHHPLMRIGNFGDYTVNWSFLANSIEENAARDLLLRGAEAYSKWGLALGKYSDIPLRWIYDPQSCCDSPFFWVENGLWEWSNPEREGQPFVLIASSDNHAVDRPGSASMESRVKKNHPNPSGIVGAYAVHNTREEIWDALNNCTVYGSQLLKTRVHARFDGEFAPGRWISCTCPLQISVTAFATFPGGDRAGKTMQPHAYSSEELDYPISDIWIIKKDVARGQPWCKIVYHDTPESDLAVVNFQDSEVQPYDFYYVVVRQQGDTLETVGVTESDTPRNEYLSYFGPVFIADVTN